MKYYDAVLITLIYALEDQRHQVSKHKQLLMWTYIININRCKQKQTVDIDNVHKRNLTKMVVLNVYHLSSLILLTVFILYAKQNSACVRIHQ